MSIPRRSFLKSATLSTLSAGLALGSAQIILGQQQRRGVNQDIRQTGLADGDFPIPAGVQQDALYYFRQTTFKPYVGDIFQTPNALGDMIELRLTRVSEYKMKAATRISTRRSPQPESFSLTFTSREQLPPLTSIYRVSHPALGTFDLFLTTSEAEDGTFLYEAVFNHLR